MTRKIFPLFRKKAHVFYMDLTLRSKMERALPNISMALSNG